MLTLPDAAALSSWSKARSPRLGEFLRAHGDNPPRHEVNPAQGGSHGGRSSHDCYDDGGDLLAAIMEYVDAGAGEGLAATLRERGDAALQRAQRAGIVPIPWGDPRYPPLLALIRDPPVVLWVKGREEVLPRPAAALVGSRSPSPYGVDAVGTLATGLATARITVVSGLARGIDSAAHRASLKAGGLTVAVLGSGTDVVYPPEHGALADSIAETGAVVSELPPGTQPLAFHFPARNRIISGLSLAVVVVEAAEQSGSLITADFAVEQGREVLAVPGTIFGGRQAGCHALIRDGAGVAASAGDVVWSVEHSVLRRLAADEAVSWLPPSRLLDQMSPGEAYDIDVLARQTGQKPAVLLSRLLELELQGAVRRTEGSRFMRVCRTC